MLIPAASALLFTGCAALPGPPVPLGLGPPFDVPWLVLAAGFIGILVWKFGAGVKKTGKKNAAEAPEGIVSQRYARGEITRDQYLQMLADLSRRT